MLSQFGIKFQFVLQLHCISFPITVFTLVSFVDSDSNFFNDWVIRTSADLPIFFHILIHAFKHVGAAYFGRLILT